VPASARAVLRYDAAVGPATGGEELKNNQSRQLRWCDVMSGHRWLNCALYVQHGKAERPLNRQVENLVDREEKRKIWLDRKKKNAPSQAAPVPVSARNKNQVKNRQKAHRKTQLWSSATRIVSYCVLVLPTRSAQTVKYATGTSFAFGTAADVQCIYIYIVRWLGDVDDFLSNLLDECIHNTRWLAVDWLLPARVDTLG